MHLSRVLKSIRSRLHDLNLQGVVIVNPYDLYYLLGFTSHEEGDGVLLVTENFVAFFTDGRYLAGMEKTANTLKSTRLKVVDWSDNRWEEVIGYLQCHRRLAWDGTSSVNFLEEAQAVFKKHGVGILTMNGVAAPYRLIKTPAEIRMMRWGGGIMDQLFEQVLTNGVIRPGMTQVELRDIVNGLLRGLARSDTLAFETMVLFGENGFSPHAQTETNDRPLRYPDSILIDCGVHLGSPLGLCTDATMTVFVGQPREEFVLVNEVLTRAMNNAFRWIRPGITGEEADGYVRRIMEKAGYKLIHGTGHGFGHQVHEMPSLSAKNPNRKMVLEKGMTFTIEPGIYSENGAVRWEVFGVLTDDGFVPFNTVPLEPLETFIIEP